ncbi:hypothetical protein [Tatumella saanichensis]|nr:hypothetical protein [Tatumella saanichensis]
METPDDLLVQRPYNWLSAHHSGLENQMTELSQWLQQPPPVITDGTHLK